MPSAPRSPRSRRLDPDARRGQLVTVGLDMMKTIPFDRITPDEIARRAGVSKGLVFHYFDGKGDLQAAVLRAAADELLAEISLGITVPDAGTPLPVGERLRAGLEAFVGYIEQRPENYLAISQRAGSDPRLLAVFEDTRSAIVRLIGTNFGMPELTPGLQIVVRGWIAMVEDSVLHWLEDGEPVPRDALLGFLERAALSMLPDALMSFPPAAELRPAADRAG